MHRRLLTGRYLRVSSPRCATSFSSATGVKSPRASSAPNSDPREVYRPCANDLMRDEAAKTRAHRPRSSAQEMGRDAIRDAIVQEEALLATLEDQQDESRHRL